VTTPLGDEDAEVQSGPRLLAGVPFLSPGAQAPSLGHFSCWIGVRAPEPLTWQGGDVAGAPAQPGSSALGSTPPCGWDLFLFRAPSFLCVSGVWRGGVGDLTESRPGPEPPSPCPRRALESG
jgi:hypothetical protein